MAPTVIIQKVRENKLYRLPCRFKVDPYPAPGALESGAVTVAEQFVADMHKQGWEHVTNSAWKLDGPFQPIVPVTIRPMRQLSARHMLPHVLAGARFLDHGNDTASLVRPLREYDYWEYELSGVFYRPQILVEYPDAHEEEKQ